VLGWIIRTPQRGFLLLFLLSVAVRATLLPLLPLDPVRTVQWENGAVAENLIRTGEYANPYLVTTGPTAHPIPFYTGMLALIYRLFRVTMAAEHARCWLAIAGFSSMYALLPWFATHMGIPPQAGLLGGIMGALSPLHLPMGLCGGLGEEYAGLAMILLLLVHLGRWTSASCAVNGALVLGVAWGAVFHISPALLPVMAGCLAFEIWWNRRRRGWLLAAVMALGVGVACAPWTWRNYRAFHEVFFIRSNLGLELRMGNHPGVAATMEPTDGRRSGPHPRTDVEEAERVRELGEMEYMRRAGREARQWIIANPGTFTGLTLSRFAHFWLGPFDQPRIAVGFTLLTILAMLGLRRVLPTLGAPQQAAVLIPLVAFPLLYYVLCYTPRYRVPIDWLLLLLAGVEVWRWFGGDAGRECAAEA
jgi:hypothetical protein